jgi:hypothetical protein
MKPKSQPDVVELDLQDLEAKLGQIEQSLGTETARPFRILLSWYLTLLGLIQKKNTTIGRLRRLLFGTRTERTRDVVQGKQDSDAAKDRSDDVPGAT